MCVLGKGNGKGKAEKAQNVDMTFTYWNAFRTSYVQYSTAYTKFPKRDSSATL